MFTKITSTLIPTLLLLSLFPSTSHHAVTSDHDIVSLSTGQVHSIWSVIKFDIGIINLASAQTTTSSAQVQSPPTPPGEESPPGQEGQQDDVAGEGDPPPSGDSDDDNEDGQDGSSTGNSKWGSTGMRAWRRVAQMASSSGNKDASSNDGSESDDTKTEHPPHDDTSWSSTSDDEDQQQDDDNSNTGDAKWGSTGMQAWRRDARSEAQPEDTSDDVFQPKNQGGGGDNTASNRNDDPNAPPNNDDERSNPEERKNDREAKKDARSLKGLKGLEENRKSKGAATGSDTKSGSDGNAKRGNQMQAWRKRNPSDRSAHATPSVPTLAPLPAFPDGPPPPKPSPSSDSAPAPFPTPSETMDDETNDGGDQTYDNGDGDSDTGNGKWGGTGMQAWKRDGKKGNPKGDSKGDQKWGNQMQAWKRSDGDNGPVDVKITQHESRSINERFLDNIHRGIVLDDPLVAKLARYESRSINERYVDKVNLGIVIDVPFESRSINERYSDNVGRGIVVDILHDTKTKHHESRSINERYVDNVYEGIVIDIPLETHEERRNYLPLSGDDDGIVIPIHIKVRNDGTGATLLEDQDRDPNAAVQDRGDRDTGKDDHEEDMADQPQSAGRRSYVHKPDNLHEADLDIHADLGLLHPGRPFAFTG